MNSSFISIALLILIIALSGCIEATTLGLQATDQSPTDSFDSSLPSALCAQQFISADGSDAETCNSLKVNLGDEIYNCKFNEQKNSCFAQPN